MRFISAILPWFGLFFCHHVSADEADSSIIRFANQDKLRGSLVSLAPDGLVWQSPVLEKPAPFALKKVIELCMPASAPEESRDHDAVVTLTNGDIIRGQLVSVTDQVISLETWFAGRLDFNRLMVSDLKIESLEKLVYRGPSGIDGWRQTDTPPVWTYQDAALVASDNGGIARDGVLPDECTLAFQVAWKGDECGLKVILFSSDSATDGSSSGYEFSFQRGSIYVRNGKTLGLLGGTNARAMLEDQSIRVKIQASKKSGKLCLFINDRFIEQWADPEVAKGAFGRALHFISQSPQKLRISSIKISPWDGISDHVMTPKVGMLGQFGIPGLESGAPAKTPAEPTKDGRMLLANGDSLDGEVVSISDGIITVKSGLGEIKLPVSRLRSVALKKVDLERCIRKEGDIRVWLPDGSSMVFRLDAVGEGSLTGYSQNFGTAIFKIAAFHRIEFNIYEPDYEDLRAADRW